MPAAPAPAFGQAPEQAAGAAPAGQAPQAGQPAGQQFAAQQVLRTLTF